LVRTRVHRPVLALLPVAVRQLELHGVRRAAPQGQIISIASQTSVGETRLP